MEAIYLPGLSEERADYSIEGDEYYHVKALRLKINDSVTGLSGDGLAADMAVTSFDKKKYYLTARRFYKNYNENDFSLALAIGILSAKDRFEIAVEKAVELGVTEIYPLITDFTQKKHYKTDRLKAKALAAMKQCKRSKLPLVHDAMDLHQLISLFPAYENIYLCHPGGSRPAIAGRKDSLLLIGPEGGFSNKELELLNKESVIQWELGQRRLRAETAAIAALSFFI